MLKLSRTYPLSEELGVRFMRGGVRKIHPIINAALVINGIHRYSGQLTSGIHRHSGQKDSIITESIVIADISTNGIHRHSGLKSVRHYASLVH